MDGFIFRKGKGDHWVGEKSETLRPVVIPAYSEIGLDIIVANMRTAQMSRARFLRLLEKC